MLNCVVADSDSKVHPRSLVAVGAALSKCVEGHDV